MFSQSNGVDDRLSRYDHVVIHCSATAPHVSVDAAWVDNEHKRRGWRGCGYHAVITREGQWQDADDGYPARPIGHQGAHVGDCGRGWNGRSFGICLAGGVDENGVPEDNFAPGQWVALEWGLDGFLSHHYDPRNVAVLGHRDLIALTQAPPKACPCFDVHERLDPFVSQILARMSALATRLPGETPETGSHSDALLLPLNHVVVAGDTLGGIALRYGVSVESLTMLNTIADEDAIRVGYNLSLREEM